MGCCQIVLLYTFLYSLYITALCLKVDFERNATFKVFYLVFKCALDMNSYGARTLVHLTTQNPTEGSKHPVNNSIEKITLKAVERRGSYYSKQYSIEVNESRQRQRSIIKCFRLGI